jgi:SAM-dependent methyltransferase
LVSGKAQPFVVELGCNDGIMLKHIAERSIPHLGIEPSENVAASAKAKGVNVLGEFFNSKSASEIMDVYGQADVICGANVMCHIEDISSVFEGISILLKPEGVFFFEDPYLLDIVEKTSFDQIYDEHIYYFSGLSISNMAKRHGLKLVDMASQEVHGGSMRYFLKKEAECNASGNVGHYLSREKTVKLHTSEGYIPFKERVDKICFDFKNTLLDIKAEGKRIAAYGATSKSTTLLNYAGVGSDLIEYVSDTTPTKIGKYTPGTHIPVKPYDYFLDDQPPYTVLLAWNHKREIFAKERQYRENGGKFITFFPDVIIE